MLGLAAFLWLVSGVPETAPPVTLTVGDVWARHHELDGKVIRVVGVLKGCGRWGCVLAEGSHPEAKTLNVDLSDSSDWETESLTRHRLVVEARFNANCLHMKADPPEKRDRIIICTDAATMLHDARIVSVR